MPKSKKPPAKAAEGKPAAAKPGASAKAAPASSGKAAASAVSVGKGVSSGKAAAKAPAPAMKAVVGKKSKSLGTKTAKVVEPPQPAEPRKWPKGGPTKSELKKYRDRLLEMRRTLLSSSKELAAEALKSSGQDFSVDHMADNGSDNYEQDFSLKLLEGESEQLADIREALMKIDGKVETPYGICEACADEDQKLCETCPWIPPSRLEVLPHARLCVQTKEIEERRKQ
jgi:DnaK suppressor protein